MMQEEEKFNNNNDFARENIINQQTFKKQVQSQAEIIN